MKTVFLRTVLAMIPLFAVAAHAQTPLPIPAPPSPACETAEYSQFDFWLGDWEVTGGPKLDQIVGHNTISRVASGCALREHWVNASGRDGHSLNVYDREAKQWVQFWIGSDGVILRLVGSLRADGAMAMEGELANGKGGMQRQRIVWTPKPDGSVVQQWDTSDDDGRTWQVSFMGIYRRVPLK